MHPIALLEALVLLALANGMPVFAKRILGGRFAWPLDGGWLFVDGRPLFGPSKTVRGIAASLIVTAAAAPLLSLDVGLGLLVAALAMAGDLVSSFVKRRLGMPSSSRATGLDQIPESLFPLFACRSALSLSFIDVALGVVIFLLGNIVVSRILFRFRLRDRPY
jgi:CDP-2,3-bis-(O-geranylgeranyl)-sn-glycerol synthase